MTGYFPGAWIAAFTEALSARGATHSGHVFAGYLVDVEKVAFGAVVSWYPITLPDHSGRYGKRFVSPGEGPQHVANDVVMQLYAASVQVAVNATPLELPLPR